MTEPDQTAADLPPASLDDQDPSIPPGTTVPKPDKSHPGDGNIHRVLQSDMQSYLSGDLKLVTAVCGLKWTPNIDSNHSDTQLMCPICFPVYTNAS
jgi:hypothetical protein